MLTILAQAADTLKTEPLLTHPVGHLAALLGVLAIIFWFGQTRVGGRFFKIVPMLVFCYFVPTLLTTLGVLPDESPTYSFIKTHLLPASLLLLILALDVPGIIRLGPKAIIMLLSGTAGVVIGAPLALLVGQLVFPYASHAGNTAWVLPDELWRGLTALSGSWIGGGANMVALGDIAECRSEMFGQMILVDVLVANIWMACLLFMAGRQDAIDKWTGADTSAIDDLKKRVAEFQAQTTRVPSLADLIIIVALGVVGAYVCFEAGNWLAGPGKEGTFQGTVTAMTSFLGATTWKFILVTTLGVVLSFTRVRRLEGAGASKIGSVFLYLLVAAIGAQADFRVVTQIPALFAIGIIWMLVHVTVQLVVGRLIRAPVFLIAVGSQANIGGAASAPIVASAFHPTLAPVGVLLAVAGYVLGTYAGLLCMNLLQLVAGS